MADGVCQGQEARRRQAGDRLGLEHAVANEAKPSGASRNEDAAVREEGHTRGLVTTTRRLRSMPVSRLVSREVQPRNQIILLGVVPVLTTLPDAAIARAHCCDWAPALPRGAPVRSKISMFMPLGSSTKIV